ncbi:MAG: hypothetical protein UT32_C0002G0044 [Parcubacteria group bacterium GW2011_GWC2_39_14]|nr:MAG: hypothetical protein UT32_C0002G0044 [Parcubacteria group bacterium GW2011_GWC2_39_14]KKR55269.1 MAG: hypothetical protein UT91_C0003G0044 [Parcubacteria group bacterium GW2011_GWA2_40_23]
MKKLFVIFALIFLFCSLATVVFAGEKAAIDAAIDKIDVGFGSGIVTAKGGDPSTVTQELIGNAIKILLGIMGSVALCIFIYGGIIWMTAGGTPENITNAQNTMIWAAIGLFAIFASYMIINFLIGSLTF